MKKEFFRANAGAAIFDRSGRVLACNRADVPADTWQLPQGGISRGEEPIEAVLREVREEIALDPDQLELIAEVPGWIAYELPEAYRRPKTGRGQVQKWFLFRFTGKDSDVHPDRREFSDWRWMSPAALIEQLPAFRRPVYEAVLARVSELPSRP
jgi:putative (di)nucleoside polyphosphate hydrolase